MKTTYLLVIGLFLIIGKAFGQQGFTNGGQALTGSEYVTTFAFGEVFNEQISNTDFGIKNGIIQYTSSVGTFVSSPELLDISIFPNPATDFIEIVYNGNRSFQYSIFNSSLKLIDQDKLTSEKINIDQFVPGAYILRLEIDQYIFSKLFVKI